MLRISAPIGRARGGFAVVFSAKEAGMLEVAMAIDPVASPVAGS